ncbi:MAG: FxsA family protein [Desulfomonilia bacterium]|nr:FxsA family protein [Desulfomonilia bacterium]
MFLKLFLLFTLIPIVEIYLLIRVGEHIGAGNTIALVIITGITGAYLARVQGLQILSRIRRNLDAGIMPSGELIDALLVLVAGIVLITPGFMTDCIGFLLLIPPTRLLLKRELAKRLDLWIRKKHVHITYDT